jgi:hypothetical protein
MVSRRSPLGADFAFNTGLRLLEEQERRTNALDSKAGVLLAAAGVLAGLVFRGDSSLREAPLPVSVLLTTLIVSTVALALIAFGNRRYETAPAPRAVTRMMTEDESWLRWRFLGNVLEAIDANERKLAWKAKTVTVSQVAFLASVLTLSGYFIYTVIERWI